MEKYVLNITQVSEDDTAFSSDVLRLSEIDRVHVECNDSPVPGSIDIVMKTGSEVSVTVTGLTSIVVFNDGKECFSTKSVQDFVRFLTRVLAS